MKLYKISLFIFSIFSLITCLSGCYDLSYGNDDWLLTEKESSESVEIEYNILTDFTRFKSSVDTYAKSYNDNLELSNMRLYYDENMQVTAEIEYSYCINEYAACGLSMFYDGETKSVNQTYYAFGAPKAVNAITGISLPYDNYNTENWNVSFEDGLNLVKECLKKSGRDKRTITSIEVYCFADSWSYRFNGMSFGYLLNPETGEVTFDF